MKHADNDLLRRTFEKVELLVNSGTAPVKKALRFPISVIAALELAVAAEDRLPVGARVSAWARLLKINGNLRMDDLQRLHPENVTMGDAGLTGRMMRTRCSGTEKKVRELLLFVPRALGLVRRDWLRIGYKLWREAASFARDFFLPRISSDYATFIPKLASGKDLAGMLNGVLTLLMVPVVDDVGTGLVESDMKMMTAMYAAGWPGHSERATMMSVLAAGGYSQEDRAYLGRWAAGSSEEYVRTYQGGHKKVDPLVSSTSRRHLGRTRLSMRRRPLRL